MFNDKFSVTIYWIFLRFSIHILIHFVKLWFKGNRLNFYAKFYTSNIGFLKKPCCRQGEQHKTMKEWSHQLKLSENKSQRTKTSLLNILFYFNPETLSTEKSLSSCFISQEGGSQFIHHLCPHTATTITLHVLCDLLHSTHKSWTPSLHLPCLFSLSMGTRQSTPWRSPGLCLYMLGGHQVCVAGQLMH